MKLWSALDRSRPAAPAGTSSLLDGEPRFEDLVEDPRGDEPSARAGLLSGFAGTDLRSWRANGYVIKRGFVPAQLIDAYCVVRARLDRLEGWLSPVPYLHVPEIRDLCLYEPLLQLLARLVGAEMGMHLNLTGWVSTERTWHQDHYLNPDFVRAWYCGVWFALDRIDPDAGPIEIVPGSHLWGAMSGEKVRARLPAEEARQIGHKHNGDAGHWAKYAEPFVTRAFEDKIVRSGATPLPFLAEKGDVLVWHSRLVHRGSAPRRGDLLRKAIITHYSAIAHRPDMVFVRHDNGGSYANFDIPLY